MTGILLQRNSRQEWWCMPVTLVLWGWGRRILKQEDDVSMKTVVRLSRPKPKQRPNKKEPKKGNCVCSCVISTFHSLHRNTHCQHWPLRASGPGVLWQCSEELPWWPPLRGVSEAACSLVTLCPELMLMNFSSWWRFWCLSLFEESFLTSEFFSDPWSSRQ